MFANKKKEYKKLSQKYLMGFPRKETNSIFCGVFKSRFKRKVIKNVKEYE